MCGIAGVVDLCGTREIDPAMLERMASAIAHRGPDESGFLLRPGVGLSSRRLSIVGLEDGRQPIFNEDRSVAVVFNGEIFDYPERRAELSARGHRFAHSCDTEVLVHLWEEQGEAMFTQLRGQFAFALLDTKQRVLILARDRIGIVPLHWARRDGFLYFGSEIKAILATGKVTPEPDPKGIDHIFTFFAMGTRRTAFHDIHAIAPASYLSIRFGSHGEPADVCERSYWDFSFPQSRDDYDLRGEEELVEDFGELVVDAVRVRLRADVPVVGYLSGGVDSTTVMLTASHVLGRPVPSFTIRIPAKGLDETNRAMLAAERIGSQPTIVTCDSDAICDAYPDLIVAAEVPVMDTSCGALYLQAQEVRRQGYKVALSGEGADDALAGYPWFKAGAAIGLLDSSRMRPSNVVRRALAVITGNGSRWERMRAIQDRLGGPNGLLDFYTLISLSRHRFYSPQMWDRLEGFTAFEDLQINEPGLRRWHPLNRALYLGYKTMVPGLLMSQKGDRPAMHNSVETRYPFLDAALIDFCARLPQHFKLRGLMNDKYLLRQYAARILPRTIALRRKAMFRAPFANTFFRRPPPFVQQLLSEESIRATGYFTPDQIRRVGSAYGSMSLNPAGRLVVEMGLVGVMATQLWHHTFFGGGLCELPAWTPPPRDKLKSELRRSEHSGE